jgi:hypothetical protein
MPMVLFVKHLVPYGAEPATVHDSQQAYTWGSGQGGQLGNGTSGGTGFPYQVRGAKPAVLIVHCSQ